MRIIKKINRHFELRVQQEVLCELCCRHSQNLKYLHENNYPVFPRLDEFSRINRAVKRVDKLIPSLYWVLSYIDGSATRMKKEIKKRLEKHEK